MSRSAGMLMLTMMLVALGAAAPATAGHQDDPRTRNMHPMGESPNPASFFNVTPETPAEVNSDIAFWGDLAFNGNYDGFRIIDISSPGNPKEIVHQRCNGNQGDVVVWEDIVVRSWNSPAPGTTTCDGEPVPAGFEGLHVFDTSDLTDPDLVASIDLPCGSHTATGVPDPANGRLLIYNNGSSSACPWFEIIAIPFDDPGSPVVLGQEPLVGAARCHDISVIQGEANLATCASGAAANVYDIGENATPGGSLEDPVFLFSISEPGVGVGGNWHSAAFTWDGEVIVLGWEPGGGAQAECEATDPDVKKSMFFYDAGSGAKLGQWVLPRPQTATENCTIHNYNILPTRDGSYIATGGHYQAGTWIVDFSDPANATTLAWSDPPPIVPTDLGGAWSSYWYNNFVYESSITEGLNIFRVSGKATGGTMKLDHLNPQTQEFTLR